MNPHTNKKHQARVLNAIKKCYRVENQLKVLFSPNKRADQNKEAGSIFRQVGRNKQVGRKDFLSEQGEN